MKRSPENKNEVIDITFTLVSDQPTQCLFRMQEVQEEINRIQKMIQQGKVNDDDLEKRNIEIENNEKKLKRLKEKYRNLITRGKQFKKEDLRYLPKSKRFDTIEFVFVTFKRCLAPAVAIDNISSKKGIFGSLK